MEENIQYEIILEAPKVCTDDDTEEVLNTNFHCPLDDKDINKSDVIRHFVLKKMCETEHDESIIRVFRFSVKEDEAIVKMIENWRVFMNSVNWDITIKIKDLQIMI